MTLCKAGDVCYWPAPHNFKSEEGAEIIQFSDDWRPGRAGRCHRRDHGRDGASRPRRSTRACHSTAPNKSGRPGGQVADGGRALMPETPPETASCPGTTSSGPAPRLLRVGDDHDELRTAEDRSVELKTRGQHDGPVRLRRPACRPRGVSGTPRPPIRTELLQVIWGTTLGLALAHFYAFRVSSRLVRGRLRPRDLTHRAGATRGRLGRRPPVHHPGTWSSRRPPRTTWSGSGSGCCSARPGTRPEGLGGISRLRSFFLGALVLAVGVVVALVKNALSH